MITTNIESSVEFWSNKMLKRIVMRLSEKNKLESTHDLSTGVQTESVIVLVPGMHVTVRNIPLPIKHHGQLAAAVPYALEEHLAVPIEACHFAWQKHKTSELYTVAVVTQDVIQTWVASLKQAGITAAIMIPDYFALPYEKDTWFIAFHNEMCLIRLGEASGCIIEKKHLETLVRLFLLETPPKIIRCWGTNETEIAKLEGMFQIAIQNQPGNTSLLEFLTSSLSETVPINLLQGTYQFREPWKKQLFRFKPALLLFSAAIILELFLQIFHFVYYKIENSKLDIAITELYQQTFPEDKRIINPKVQMQNHLKRLREQDASHDFFGILGQVAPAMTSESGVQLLGLRYNSGQNEMDLDLETSDYQLFEKIRQYMSTHFSVEVRSTNVTEGNLVRGGLRLKWK